MKPFSHLLPETLMTAVQQQGFQPTGVFYPLNSYENRVYEIQLEEHDPIVAKFYRPGRWSAEAIGEEHRFTHALVEAEIPVVEPLSLSSSLKGFGSLAKIDDILYAFYPKFRGRQHSDLSLEELEWLGRSLGRLHNVGEAFKAKHRLQLSLETYGYGNVEFILTQPFLPKDLVDHLKSSLYQALKGVEAHFPKNLLSIPLHGDCHHGNILWGKEGPVLLDFDDMVIAPPVQDIWMLFFGSKEEQREQQDAFFKGYELFRDFDFSTLRLAEPLRTLRLIHHSAWIGRRYEEEIFQRAFPYYREHRYWEEFLQTMKEQISLLQELGY
jgi:Ser/Thr protein kinase RdoA (MazF antagonist)